MATKIASVFAEIISSGENLLCQASQKMMNSSAIVMAMFGHAFNCHCPAQVSCRDEEGSCCLNKQTGYNSIITFPSSLFKGYPAILAAGL